MGNIIQRHVEGETVFILLLLISIVQVAATGVVATMVALVEPERVPVDFPRDEHDESQYEEHDAGTEQQGVVLELQQDKEA